MPVVTSILAQDTKNFWMVSKTFNGRVKTGLTTETAIKKLGKIQDNSLERQKIYWRVTDLLDDIINRNVERPITKGRHTNTISPIKEAVEK